MVSYTDRPGTNDDDDDDDDDDDENENENEIDDANEKVNKSETTFNNVESQSTVVRPTYTEEVRQDIYYMYVCTLIHNIFKERVEVGDSRSVDGSTAACKVSKVQCCYKCACCLL